MQEKRLVYVCKDARELPSFTDIPTELEEGMYVALTDGREDLSDSDTWGFDGPVIGPLLSVFGRYGTEYLIFADAQTRDRYFPAQASREKQAQDRGWIAKLTRKDGLFEFDGRFFAVMTGFTHPQNDSAAKHVNQQLSQGSIGGDVDEQ